MRIKQDWMKIEQDEIDSMTEDNWLHYSDGGCICHANSKSDCVCGAWWRE